MEPSDTESWKYIVNAQEALNRQEWPSSTRESEMHVLRWHFRSTSSKFVSQTDCEISMVDSAGQDLRNILLNDPGIKLTDKQKEIREEINQSQLLIFLLDLDGFQAGNDLRTKNENAWIFRNFVMEPLWQNRKRMVIVTKADRLQGLIDSKAGDVREVIKDCLPESFSLRHLLDIPGICYMAANGIKTTTVLDSNQDPRQLPDKNLTPGDLKEFVDRLCEVCFVIQTPTLRPRVIMPHNGSQMSPPLNPKKANDAIFIFLLAAFGMCVPGLGILALIWGALDLSRMANTTMDASGRRDTIAGMLLGAVDSVLWLAFLLGFRPPR
jgi:hypothetical protein